ncbi:MAG: hypothetical protein ACD_20C00391G0012 [uncultured bacterium]|nr:MAG: hypothetical protein ACD_20C00391G0012 [uncultured bacterium]HBH17332.1 hypothetical protein [Cyanobacteria bacterium UBA9579]
MGEGNSLINLGDLSKPVTVLLEKISDAIGIVYEPHQIKRIAKAEVEADKIRALGKIEVNELEQRALVRFVNEETKKQINMEEIIKEAISGVNQNARPEDIEDDWISNFFEKSRLISDKEMQLLWANILSGESNKPGTFSKRTVNFMSSLDKNEAMLFKNLCSFAWEGLGPLIFEPNAEIYNKNSIDFGSLQHLDSIGLINFNILSDFLLKLVSNEVLINYYGKPLYIKFNKVEDNVLKFGKVNFTQIGKELSNIVNTDSNPDFFKYTISQLKENNPNIEKIEEYIN